MALASVDGRRIVTGVASASSGAFQLALWDGKSGAKLAKLSGPHAAFTSFALSSDGKKVVASTEQNTIVVSSAEDGAQLLELRGAESTIGVAFVTADLVVGAASDGRVTLWDLVTGRQLLVRGRTGDRVQALRVSPEARVVLTVHESGNLSVWPLRFEEGPGQAVRRSVLQLAEALPAYSR